ncbi:Leucine-rich repeat domain superfamily [Sesbania bispinosa]|nr:Leucine-rich repeat domain superfamily [Sesbania bispinosa]
MPSYTMQSTLLPKGICLKIEKYCREFVRGDKPNKKIWHTVHWDDFKLPKHMGGWGFRNLYSFNKVMIMKLNWGLIHNPDALWRSRNEFVHNHKAAHVTAIVHSVLQLVRDSSRCLHVPSHDSPSKSVIQVGWTPPPEGWLKANSDGSVRMGGSRSACGGALCDQLGRWVSGFQQNLGQTAFGEKDLISKLHESILGHILSFLPTVEAICTSVLSRRWIHVWTSITSVEFDDALLFSGKKMQQEQFVNFVNRVLLHLANSTIQSFSLCLTRYHYDASQVSAWISFILERRVQKLQIQYADKVLISSHSLFSCSSLVDLVLQTRCTLSVPISASLPNLQKLSISGIRLVSDSSTYSKDIVLSFPVLKVFEARGCEWSTIQNISIQAPLLERQKDNMKKLGFQAHKLLRQIHEVERLKLLFYKVLMHAKDIFTHLPAFGRLTYLQLNEVTGEALLHLLHNSPILNTLVLLNGVSDLNKDILTSASVPHCFQSSLKVFQFKGFNVHEHELYLAKFVMANAAILERMTISTAFWLRYVDIDMEKVKEQIFSLPKCSRFCEIEFSNDSVS